MRYSHALLGVLLAALGCAGERAATGPVASATVSDDRVPSLVVGKADLSDLPAGYVPTPSGEFYHKSCIHEVPNQAEILVGGDIYLRGALVRRVTPCAFPRYRRGRPLDALTHPPTISGWLQWASATPDGIGGDAYSSVETSLIVPPNPTNPYSTPGKLYYTFPGLQPAYGTGPILQPVLTFGRYSDYGGAFWTITPWMCGATDCYHGLVYTVIAGDTISAAVAPTTTHWQCYLARHCYGIAVANRRTGDATEMSVVRPEAMRWAAGGAEEVYNLGQCSELPAGPAQYVDVRLGQWFFTTDSRMLTNAYQAPGWTWRGADPSTSPWCDFDVYAIGSVVTLSHN